ncbi:unnamed protein product [Rotaria sordida]|uniref:LamG domain-containing protein n=1 Tax=Rotaria sordida TaxID=392033 RepID=A0A814KWD8_9BILA|nr:unnamed protein product [Rotaria sordida]CAF1056597.1 unnamed protein product [Rotaria sordida]
MNSASYFSTTNSQPFVGYGRGLSLLSSSSSQYMRVSSLFLDLTYRSFTIEAWIFSTTVYSGDYGIFSQCQCTTCSNQCLYFLVRGGYLFAGFTHNDISGSQNLINNLCAYQEINETIDIGSTLVLLIRNYFNGYIDNVKITTRAKTSDEILTAATLAGYFSFDMPSPYNDNGPNSVNGTQNTIYRCHNLIGIFSNYGTTGQIIIQGWSSSWIILVGPYLTTNTWTHISVTYSYTNGLSLYVNGGYFGQTDSFTFTNSGYITYLQLGFMYTCSSSSSVSNSAYQGSVDEVYVHSRELTQAEVTTLASS